MAFGRITPSFKRTPYQALASFYSRSTLRSSQNWEVLPDARGLWDIQAGLGSVMIGSRFGIRQKMTSKIPSNLCFRCFSRRFTSILSFLSPQVDGTAVPVRLRSVQLCDEARRASEPRTTVMT